MDELDERISRISYFESLLDDISEKTGRLSSALGDFEMIAPEVEELKAYYTGKDWRKDLEADEAGLLPKALKRGVLSEDAVYDMLDEVERLRAVILPEENG